MDFVVFRGSRRLNLKAEDFTLDNLAMIFQVRAPTVYLTDDNNRGILPGSDGVFSSTHLQNGGHYEVHGESIADEGPSWQGRTPPSFAFRSPTSAPASLPAPRATGPKINQRNVFIAEVVDGKPETQKTVTVRFSDLECSVASIRAKVSEALGDDEPIVLLDNHGSEIMECEATKAAAYWKQHARKVYAVPMEQLHRLRRLGSKRRRESRKDDAEFADLPVAVDQIEEVILVSQGLPEVSRALKDLVNYVQANPRTTVCLSVAEAEAVKAAFACLICGDAMRAPTFASCCKSLVGCRTCVERWQANHHYCPKCRAVDSQTESVVALDEALAALHNIVSSSSSS